MSVITTIKRALADLRAVPFGEATIVGTGFSGHAYRDTTLTFQQIRAMRKHPVVKFCLQFLKMPLARVSVTPQCDDDIIRALVQEAYEPVLNNYMRMGANSLDYGFQAFEVIWAYRNISAEVNGATVERMMVVPGAFKQLRPEDVVLLVDERNEFKGIEYRNANGSAVTLSKEKSLLVTNRYEDGNLYGISELEAVKKPWSRQDNTETFMMRYLEGKADPTPVVRFDSNGVYQTAAGVKVDTREEAYNLGKNIRQGRPVALPATSDEKGNFLWDIKYLESADRVQLFRAAMEYHDTAMMRALLVPERSLTQAEASGSYSMAEAHGGFLVERQEEVIDMVVNALNEQNLPALMAYNFGAAKYNIEMKAGGLTTEDKALATTVITQLLAGGVLSDDQKEWLEKKTGVPFSKEAAIPESPAAAPVPALSDCKCGKEHRRLSSLGWRPARAWEGSIKLGALDSFLNSWLIKTEAVLLNVIAKQQDKYTRKLESLLSNNRTTAAKLAAVKGLELAYQMEYRTTLYNSIAELMEQTAQWACEELKVRYQGLTPTAIGWARTQADATWYKHDGDLRSALNFAVTDAISRGKTDKDILWSTSEVWQLWTSPSNGEALGRLGQMALVIASQGVNRGREVARETYDDSDEAEENPIVAVQRSEVLDKVVCRYCHDVLDEKIVDIKDPAYEEYFLVEPHYGCRGVNVFIRKSERAEFRNDPEYQFKKPTDAQLENWTKEKRK
jgi:hypothetical protein